MLEIAAFTGALSSISALIRVANETKNVEMTGKLIDLQQKNRELTELLPVEISTSKGSTSSGARTTVGSTPDHSVQSAGRMGKRWRSGLNPGMTKRKTCST